MRCQWATDALMVEYHDKEWGVPLHDDRKLFEMLSLEGAQAGLSWETILRRRESYRKALDDFDARKVSRYSKRDFDRLIHDEGIIRNRKKIQSVISNAKRFLEIQKEFGSFDRYIWSFVGFKPVIHSFRDLRQIPSSDRVSDDMSRDLKKRGFSFVGSTICYAFMQAVGMVNDHSLRCFRYAVLKKLA